MALEGKDNENHASFGVPVFEVPKQVQDKKVKGVTLALVQSVPKFAKDGPIRFFLVPEVVDTSVLKFDPSARDGIGSQIKALHDVGAGAFKKAETGKTQSFSLTMDEIVREQIVKGGKLYLVIVSADATVAAT